MLKILVVDDLIEIANVIQLYFKFKNILVDICFNGLLAIEKLKNNYDLILTDIRMPKMDGIGLIKYIKLLNPSQRVAVMTGYYPSLQNLQRYIVLHNTLFTISKPILILTLLNKVILVTK